MKKKKQLRGKGPEIGQEIPPRRGSPSTLEKEVTRTQKRRGKKDGPNRWIESKATSKFKGGEQEEQHLTQ